jgi:hypothetical protein
MSVHGLTDASYLNRVEASKAVATGHAAGRKLACQRHRQSRSSDFRSRLAIERGGKHQIAVLGDRRRPKSRLGLSPGGMTSVSILHRSR